jgi:pSer/pThr/pTyr-binding forkhead associated (FHA) protein
LQSPNGVVRVGRYSERDHKAAGDTANSPVGFKSKVVSRRHCEFWHNSGQWYVKDVKSSSGTFLNHVRLSSPGVESRPFPVNDGDIVQLGIDFKGGEDDIYRCVKMRIECNRTWQKSANKFNTSAHKKLLQNALRTGTKRASDAGSISNSECTICFNKVSPCQALFVAPCGHVWHYKCIRQILVGPHYPNFPCPNCRLVADLEAEVDQSDTSEDDAEDADKVGSSNERTGPTSNASHNAIGQRNGSSTSAGRQHHSTDSSELRDSDGWTDAELAHALATTNLHDADTSIPVAEIRLGTPGTDSDSRSLVSSPQGNDQTPESSSRPIFVNGSTSISHPEGPMTPRNDAGPFILDGGGINGISELGESESDTSGAQTRRL